MNISFLGFGELGKQVELLLNSSNYDYPRFYFDDKLSRTSNNHFYFNEYINHINNSLWLLCVGYKHMSLRLKLITEISNASGKLLNLVHPTAYVSPLANVSSGSLIYPMCNLDKEVFLGKGVLINNSVTISHNCEIQDGSYISPGVTISGNVKIGQASFVGSGTVISNDIVIGNHVHIGIGTVITQDVPDDAWVIGNPQKILNKPFKLN
ncbi:hypothetical protein L3556_15950 [Candidatus Synechococcus calcipolaris G9]|uniref:Mannose-1-phosphate guanyltransferase C-terminal domain-containing protein n=1 Tax=Candidatus Synechococcus calcipolaris G9 TaxID=1497997 RepID=A0ABT6F3I7_9SYNE|nr:hypothetical protein [Candidatus Synechococcus calcipolaris]MDG2992412.1 hypothetical protein [Candidatus Synechococcus calcipolaris G9]